MTVENQLEKLIVENVIKELAKKGLLNDGSVAGSVTGNITCTDKPVDSHETASSEEAVALPPADEVLVPNPINLEAIKRMKQITPARIGIWRAGARPKTVSWLRLQADHAAAQDAVFRDVSEDFLNRMGLFSVQTAAANKDEFLTRLDLGRKLSEEAKKTILEKCEKNVQVQVLVVDGLSSSAIEANIPDLLPALIQGLKTSGIKVGTPFFIKYGRVWVQDEVAKLLNAEVVVSLIGERPGLVTADSLSAYIIYRPDEKTVEADRTCVSNIHKGGIPPAEAGAHLATLIKQIIEVKASGVKFTRLTNKGN